MMMLVVASMMGVCGAKGSCGRHRTESEQGLSGEESDSRKNQKVIVPWESRTTCWSLKKLLGSTQKPETCRERGGFRRPHDPSKIGACTCSVIITEQCPYSSGEFLENTRIFLRRFDVPRYPVSTHIEELVTFIYSASKEFHDLPSREITLA